MSSPRPVSIVTGANAGIGLEITAGLRAAGHHVVMGCRSMERCAAAKSALDARGLPGSCECRPLDLNDFASIRQFASQLQQPGSPQVACLVNNAGVMGLAPLPDGSCAHWRPNHLGPYLLTRLVLPLMAAGGRVVTVASEAHRRGSIKIHLDKSSGQRQLESLSGTGGVLGSLWGGSWYPHYCRSKLANLLMTAELTRRLQQRRSSVTCYSVSPGRVNTRLFENVSGLLHAPLRWLAAAAFQTPAQGASTALHAALSPDLAGRHELYLHAQQPCWPSAAARDAQLAAELWQLSNQQVGLSAAEDAALWPLR